MTPDLLMLNLLQYSKMLCVAGPSAKCHASKLILRPDTTSAVQDLRRQLWQR